jgi:hypothetical protein
MHEDSRHVWRTRGGQSRPPLADHSKVECEKCGGEAKTALDGTIYRHRVYTADGKKWHWCYG